LGGGGTLSVALLGATRTFLALGQGCLGNTTTALVNNGNGGYQGFAMLWE
jgi:hypothetical protein